MTPEQINVVIAKVDGWVFTPTELHAPNGYIWDLGPELPHQIDGIIPNYYGDLNAIQAVVKKLPMGGTRLCQIRFTEVLLDICGSWPDTVNASAEQRAIAMVTLLGKLNQNDNKQKTAEAAT